METLKRHLLFSGQEGLQELKKFSICFEEKIYTTTTNQMLSMEIRSQNAMPTVPMDPAGWNSTLEGIRQIFAEQFYNEKLVTDVLKNGVKEWLRVQRSC
uniref:Mediator complex subunit 15 KIX domain-containing protein n=1 Tax=Populus trichocarpa TaxID=3694 RepID=A0A2K2B0K3_POPTR